MHIKTLSVLATVLAAGTASADLQVYTVTNDMLLPETAQVNCFQTPPGVTFEYFDVRLAPEDQNVASSDGTLLVIGDCDVGGSFARHVIIGNCPGASNNIRFAHGGPSIPPNTLYDVSGNANSSPITGPYPFEPGQQVGPSADWMFDSTQRLGTSPLWTRAPKFDITDNDFRNDIDWVGDGIIIGLEITEPDGVHYGWIEIERLPGFDPQQVSLCIEEYRVVRYAYESDPGVPALVTGTPCLPDTNGDGTLSPADFSAWVSAFNANAPECDQNQDGSCTPADFSAWVINYNAGC